jgi:hypothetical protein
MQNGEMFHVEHCMYKMFHVERLAKYSFEIFYRLKGLV